MHWNQTDDVWRWVDPSASYNLCWDSSTCPSFSPAGSSSTDFEPSKSRWVLHQRRLFQWTLVRFHGDAATAALKMTRSCCAKRFWISAYLNVISKYKSSAHSVPPRFWMTGWLLFFILLKLSDNISTSFLKFLFYSLPSVPPCQISIKLKLASLEINAVIHQSDGFNNSREFVWPYPHNRLSFQGALIFSGWLCCNLFQDVQCLKRARRGGARASRLDPPD